MPSFAELIDPVCRAIDALITAGEPYGGLFPSLLDRQTGEMLEELPDPIPGQRNGDRSHPGSNLMHDEVTLRTVYALGQALDRPEYAEAADRYLERFATHCTDTATGLFPWGEHSFWHLVEDRVGNSYVHHNPDHGGPAIHDHLRQAPVWLWEKLWEFNPRCVERFAEGLDYHWQEGRHEEYIRHAPITEKVYPTPGRRSCDFPRHGGFYLLDWACAWKRTGREEFLEQIRDMLDYWWERRDERGLLLIESRSPEEDDRFYGTNAPGQTISLAASLLETAELLEESLPELAATMRERGGVYVDGFCAAPHDLDEGVFVILSDREGNAVTEAMPIWGSQYGTWPASYVALTCLCAHRQSPDGRLVEWARAVARDYIERPFPSDVAVPAMDAGLGLGLLTDLYYSSGEADWLDGAWDLATDLVEVYFDDAPLPRGAAGIEWYESQMGPGFLLHGLARTALLAEDPTGCPLEADYTAR